MAQWPQKVL